MEEVGVVCYGTEPTVRSLCPWTLVRGPLKVDAAEACVEFDLAVDSSALESQRIDTNEAAALGTESPTLLFNGELKRTSNLYCFTDGERMNYRAVFATFPPVLEVRLRWHHRASGIDVDDLLHRAE